MKRQEFKQIENKNIPQLEEQVQMYWKEFKIFEKSVENRPKDNQYVFFDGPPFISGLPHYGHVLVSIAKDLIPRYWTMKGKRVERVWGWDAHGLTVESKVQKQLGIKNRRDIESYGLKEFTKACYEYTSKTSAEWPWYIDKIGRWADMEHAYKTIDQDYMESVMWVFKQLFEKGLVYEGVRTSLYCTTCGTPVSNFEVAMDNCYKDIDDPSVFVCFPITSEGEFKNINALAWTTTPWTLPSNRALVVDENEDYVVVTFKKGKYIVAEKRLESVFDSSDYEINKTFKGKDLLGLSYEPPYRFYSWNDNTFKIYSHEGMVTMDDGTGIVHSAPGYGAVDTDMGYANNLRVMLTLTDEGLVIEGDANPTPFVGMYYKKTDDAIREDLSKRGLLFKDTVINHRFPYHDRCDTLLIQRAQNSWFINIKSLKKQMYETAKEINWIPGHLKEGRFKDGIEQAPDWAISRTRFWATPMPVWQAEDGDKIVIGSIKELEELSGQKVKDLHRPYIDEIKINKNGKVYTRVPEVFDSWFEAGSMPYGQIHYPFENEDKFNTNFPGDFIVEYIAQTRAWFYVMHVLSTALFNKNAFKNVIGTGVLAGNDGRKMSKTYGNYTDPKEVLETIGGDATRLYFMSSPLMYGGNANFDIVELKNKLKNVLNPLWNSTLFFNMYATTYNWDGTEIKTPKDTLDVWITVRLNQVIKELTESIESYTLVSGITSVESFVDDLSRWYVRRSRERIASGDLEALSTLYTVLTTFSKAVAPVIPFIAEQIYQHLVCSINAFKSDDSVHLCDYPTYDLDLIQKNQDMLSTMQFTRDVVSTALAIRVSEKIKVRQPLGTIYVEFAGKKQDVYEGLLLEELNVKQVIYSKPKVALPSMTAKEYTVYLDTTVSQELKYEGLARDMIRAIQDLRKEHTLNVTDEISVMFEQTEDTLGTVSLYGDMIKQKVSAKELIPGDRYSIIE